MCLISPPGVSGNVSYPSAGGMVYRPSLFVLILERRLRVRTKHLVILQHSPDVGTGLSNARNLVAIDPVDTGVIGRQGQGKFALVKVQQVPQLLCASAYVLDRVIDIMHTQCGRGSRCELHQADRASAGYSMLAKSGFGLDDSA